MQIVNKKQAIELCQTWYFTGVPCKNSHVDKRYVNTGICYSCKNLQNKRNNKNNPESCKIINKKQYEKNKNKILEYSKNWSKNNPEKRKLILKKNKEKHKFKYLQQSKDYNKRKRKEDPFWRISKNMSKAIWECLKNNKNQLSWIKFVDYSLEELIFHLESKFKTGMTWNNYGLYWHIDHIRPLSWFNLETEFKEAWSLNNLQPLEASINLSKCNRYEG